MFVKLAILCTIALVLFPNNSVAQSMTPKDGEIYYYKEKVDYCRFCAVIFKGDKIYYTFIDTHNDIYKDCKKTGDVQKIKRYIHSELNKELKSHSGIREQNTKNKYVTDGGYGSWSFSQDYSKLTTYSMEAEYWGMDSTDNYERISIDDILKYNCQ